MRRIGLFLCGDVMLGRGIDQILRFPSEPCLYEEHMDSALGYVRLAETVNGPIPRAVGPDYVWGDALRVLEAGHPEARIANLETAVTTSNRHWPKGINYRMHPNNVTALTAARIDCCVLANNHVLDWGQDGLMETVASLQRAGIRTAGAGRDEEEAAAAAVIPLAGGARAFVFGFAATTSGVPRAWAASRAGPGLNLLPDLAVATAARLAEEAARYRRAGDLLIASVHWGANWGYAIPGAQRAFAHALVEGGFDLVHGHSSHHPKGIEVYREKLVLYGCGDLVNDYEGISGYEEFRGDLAIMYFPELDGTTGRLISLEMVPMQIRQFRLQHPSRADATWLHGALARASIGLGTAIALRPDNRLTIVEGGRRICA
jgi:poly-gamma-glutamate capsule biosynthesis protein CapA/YwtB (metallophosphatase superfamily)